MSKQDKNRTFINGEVLTAKDLDLIYERVQDGIAHPRLTELDTNDGVHGLRHLGRELQVEVDGEWITLVTESPVYGVSIDLSNSNPETCVTYIDDAVGMIPGTDWLEQPIFNTIRPCLFKEGKVVGYLNPNNFAQFEDGTEADITSGEAGDVMIEIPKIGYKIAKAGTTLTVQITNDPAKDGFSYLAHTRDNEGDRDFLYIGAFLGSGTKSLRSLPACSPRGSSTLGDFRQAAQILGQGYDVLSFYPVTLLQCLYLIMYKSLDCQTALGMGYVGDSASNVKSLITGETVGSGMCYGSTSNREHIKFLGLEDLWGGLFHLIEGLILDSNLNALVTTNGFNDLGTGYYNAGLVNSANVGGYMTEPQGTNLLGFIIQVAGGSSSTYFTDVGQAFASSTPAFGGALATKTNAGIFTLVISRSVTASGSTYGARLMYL